MNSFKQCQRDLILTVRQGAALYMPALFLVLSVSVFMFAAGAESSVTSKATLLWLMLLLAMMNAAEHSLKDDAQNGSLRLLLLESTNPSMAVLTSLFVRAGLPILILIICMPLMAHWMGLTGVSSVALAGLCAWPALTLLAGFGASITLGLERGGWLLYLILLPLCLPLCLFGIRFTVQGAAGVVERPALYLIMAFSLMCIAVLPWIIAWAVRLGSEQ